MSPRRAVPALAVLLGLLVGSLLGSPAYADEVRDRQWNLKTLGAYDAWEHSRGDGVVVAVLDSGVDGDHPDLAGQVLAGRNVVDDNTDTSDANGHGTAVATMIAGHDDDAGVAGLAPDAKILPVRVGGKRMYDDDIADGIRWAVDHDADVINLSLGGERRSESIADAVEYALDHDVVVVAAAGNIDDEGQGIEVGYPARLPGVIAVTGITPTGKYWHNSSRGPRAALSAPATGVIAPYQGGYEYVSGTSFAAPMVAAAAALVRAKWPELSAANVVNRLLRTADDLGRKGRDSHYGYGRVNLERAVTADVAEVRTNPLLLGSSQTLRASKEPPPAAAPAPAPARGTSTVWVTVLVLLLLVVAATAILGWRLRPIRRPQPALAGPAASFLTGARSSAGRPAPAAGWPPPVPAPAPRQAPPTPAPAGSFRGTAKVHPPRQISYLTPVREPHSGVPRTAPVD